MRKRTLEIKSPDKGSHVEAFVELGPNKLTDRACSVGVRALGLGQKCQARDAPRTEAESIPKGARNIGAHLDCNDIMTNR